MECIGEYELHSIASVFSEICGSSCLGCCFASLLFHISTESIKAYKFCHQLGWGLGECVTLQLCCYILYVTKHSGCNAVFPSFCTENIGVLK
ncbi:hypothetical protein Fmac_026899 [Flemingia macrophylla]|uniref:Uncharacterized protein n=1 Tax=Flemingia macrophylla TaxID=520843 RepID=A0ABD1LHV3_9FABA